MMDESNMLILGVVGLFGGIFLVLIALSRMDRKKQSDNFPLSPEEIDSVLFAIRKNADCASKSRIAQFAQIHAERIDYVLIEMKRLGYIEETGCYQGGLNKITYRVAEKGEKNAPETPSYTLVDRKLAL